MGDTYNTTVDVGEWGTFWLAPGQSQKWLFWWGWVFNSDHWAYFDAVPDNSGTPDSNAAIAIVEQSAEKTSDGTVARGAIFKNYGNAWVSFRPRVVIAPREI